MRSSIQEMQAVFTLSQTCSQCTPLRQVWWSFQVLIACVTCSLEAPIKLLLWNMTKLMSLQMWVDKSKDSKLRQILSQLSTWLTQITRKEWFQETIQLHYKPREEYTRQGKRVMEPLHPEVLPGKYSHKYPNSTLWIENTGWSLTT